MPRIYPHAKAPHTFTAHPNAVVNVDDKQRVIGYANSPGTPPEAGDHARVIGFSTVEDEKGREARRAKTREADNKLDDSLNLAEADRARETPRARTDSLNPRMDRKLPGETTVRGMLSSRRQKALRKQSTAWQRRVTPRQRGISRRVASNPEVLQVMNRRLINAEGRKSGLGPNTQRLVGEVDAAISQYERHNDRGHIVYFGLQDPRPDQGMALREQLDAMASDGRTWTLDGYTQSTHSVGTIPENMDVVAELRTSRGAYFGSSDSTPNSDHLLPRGMVVQPVGQQTVTYTKPDGTTGQRLVVQFEDVTPQARTAAKR